MATLHELRCVLWADPTDLWMDVELRTQRSDGGLEVEPLALGASVWQRDENGPFATPAWQWFTGRGEPGWENDPRRLPDDGVAAVWGDHVARCLENAVGAAVLDGLVRSPLRVVFRALDTQCARLPFETLIWPRAQRDVPLVTNPDRAVSILRLSDRLPTRPAPPLGGRDPGTFTPLVLAAPGPGRDYALGDPLADAIGKIRPTRAIHFEGFAGVRELAAAELVVIGAHGTAAKGVEVGDRRLSGEELQAGLGGRAGAVILAICASAVGAIASASVTLEVARAGHGIVVGFQGDKAMEDHVVPFVRAIADELAPALEAEQANARVDFAPWERGLRAARQARGAAGTAAVVYVHPEHLLTGRPAILAEVRGAAARAGERITATLFYVPGQVVVFERDGAFFRVPLPVDVGDALTVAIEAEPPPHVSSDPRRVSPDDLAEIANAFGLDVRQRLRVTVQRSDFSHDGRNNVHTWAARSAGVSAVVRALAALHSLERAPAAAKRFLERVVSEDWGAPDRLARVVAVASGEAVRRLENTWPALDVIGAGHVEDHEHPLDPELASDPPRAAGFDPATLEASFRDAASVHALISAQLVATRDHATTPHNVRPASREGPGRVTIPSVAVARIADRPADGYVRVAGRSRTRSRTPDDLVC
ncbi:hypothetical protein DVA67_020435 [Solirubrobacter sp. CPCC 204708]|uniref:CHAT domain-containing protein n=1 Tax=Solirubrobacter deserti TaxID=2282478 RepID=A0ABT4RNH7_9ACTN|nr:hypothetical protein [Solirubrobacter deserti]MBE2318361.1 hypothetical protein [Solirubrobacter deserti]MDA0140119.1 hypothetical protein [Solirubrobacter deserti]